MRLRNLLKQSVKQANERAIATTKMNTKEKKNNNKKNSDDDDGLNVNTLGIYAK